MRSNKQITQLGSADTATLNRKSRRGVVLLLVVVLLVLLALIATAFIATARTDRSSAGQNTANAEIDMVLQGVQGQLAGLLNDHCYGANNGALFQFFPPGTVATAGPPALNPGFQNLVGLDLGAYASYGLPNDAYLAARHPFEPSDIAPAGTQAASNQNIVWPAISYPLYPNGSTSLFEFDDPTGTYTGTNHALQLPMPKLFAMPTSITINNIIYPALQFMNSSGLAVGSPIIGASASGDGIADSGLYKLPMAPLNDVTYYVAIRVIDNNSALNLNTAWGPEGDGQNLLTFGASYPTWFPGSIDLQDIVYRNAANNDEMDKQDTASNPGGINAWRFNMLQTISASNITPMDDCFPDPPQENGPYARQDFSYLTLNDALWNNVGRRIDNPAYIPSQFWNPSTGTGPGTPNSTNISYPRYRTFDWGDSIALAYKFSLRPESPLSNVEARLPYTTGVNCSVAINPYAPTNTPGQSVAGVQAWFATNFDFNSDFQKPGNPNYNINNNGTSFNMTQYPARTLVVARNPDSNAVIAHDMGQLWPCVVGSIAGWPTPPTANNATAFPYCQLMPFYPTWTPYGGVAKWQVPCKASLNTSSVKEVWRAFWNVMCDDADPSNPPQYTRGYNGSNGSYVYSGIFGNVIRDPRNPVYISPGTTTLPGDSFVIPALSAASSPTYTSMLLLRSAIAAANLTELRDSIHVQPNNGNTAMDFYVHSAAQDSSEVTGLAGGTYYQGTQFNITLPSKNNQSGNIVTVFGYRPQPFISEVYINTNTSTSASSDANWVAPGNKTGYVALELYNPYPFAFDVSNCAMAYVQRTASNAGNMTLTIVPGGSGGSHLSNYNCASNMSNAPSSNFLIPPHGWLVIENYDAANPAGSGQASYRPFSTGLTNGKITNTSSPGGVFPNNANFVYCSGLQYIIQNSTTIGELILLRPRSGYVNGTAGTTPDTTDFSNPTSVVGFNNLIYGTSEADSIPMDQIDLYSTTLVPSKTATTYYCAHYVRPTPANADVSTGTVSADPAAWQFVYPGRYNPQGNGSGTDTSVSDIFGTSTGYREEGLQVQTWSSPSVQPAWSYTPICLGKHSPSASYPSDYVGPYGSGLPGGTQPNGSPVPAWPTGFVGPISGFRNPIQLPNLGCAGINQPLCIGNSQPLPPPALQPNNGAYYNVYNFPFGGYARTGDMLQAPFIGAYVVLNSNINIGSPSPWQSETSNYNDIVEINSITKDAALADDLRDPTTGSPASDPFGFQNIGRFVPCDSGSSTVSGRPSGGDYTSPFNSSAVGASGGDNTSSPYRYQFAMRVFDYFSAQQNPNQDYTPNVTIDRDEVTEGAGYINSIDCQAYPGLGPYSSYIAAGNSSSPPPPTNNTTSAIAVPNSTGTVIVMGNGGSADTAGSAMPGATASLDSTGDQYECWYNAETTIGSDGYVNVNTASWKILACVPLVPNYNSDNTSLNGTTNWVATANLAKAIVYFRDIDDGSVPGTPHPHGAFRSLYELNLVPGFATAALPGNAFPTSATSQLINASVGDYFSDPVRTKQSTSPTSPPGFPAINNMSNAYRPLNDWEWTTLMVNRMSNLLSLRSDSFTAYVQVQAWQNAGNSSATMVAQRRAAYILDRSGTTGLSYGVYTWMNDTAQNATQNQRYGPVSPNFSVSVYNVPTQ